MSNHHRLYCRMTDPQSCTWHAPEQGHGPEGGKGEEHDDALLDDVVVRVGHLQAEQAERAELLPGLRRVATGLDDAAPDLVHCQPVGFLDVAGRHPPVANKYRMISRNRQARISTIDTH